MLAYLSFGSVGHIAQLDFCQLYVLSCCHIDFVSVILFALRCCYPEMLSSQCLKLCHVESVEFCHLELFIGCRVEIWWGIAVAVNHICNINS